MALPTHARYVIIGAGIHGLSTALHLSRALRKKGQGDGRDILVLDKAEPGAGATGIACGVVRNNYFQPAMRELMAHSVGVWEEDPEAYGYHPVGYMQISCEAMREDVAQIAEQQRAIDYPSTFIEGADASRHYMKNLFDDWQAAGITSVLHEQKGGYANAAVTVDGLTRKVRAENVQLRTGVKVTGFRYSGKAVSHVETDAGTVATDYLVIAAGPWIKPLWDLLELPATTDVLQNGETHHDVPVWTYWCLQEGTLGVDPGLQRTNDGGPPPVLHVDTDVPLYADGRLVTDQPWGIYYKPDYHFGGIQGGAAPWKVDIPADEVAVDPYGAESKQFTVGAQFERMWGAALAFCQKRFEGFEGYYKSNERTGGLGCFSLDSFPIFDTFRDNCYVIADSNHGFKMIGVGKLVAQELLGEQSRLLTPFRFSRFERGELHPVSHSPFPWS